MDLVFGYLAGLLTLINPCVLPILPIVLASALQSGRGGPAALAAGLSLSFVALGLVVSSIGPGLGLYPETVASAAALAMAGFGLVMLVPRFSEGFATATAGVAARADASVEAAGSAGLRGQFLGGMLMGAVWSPCIGPTLGGAIALASRGKNLLLAGAVMAAFALGVTTVILLIAYAAQSAIDTNAALMRAVAARAKPVLGAVFIAVGLGLFFNLQHGIEAWALEVLPPWLTDFSVVF
jgi:cytochrome c-type biogenesis protein